MITNKHDINKVTNFLSKEYMKNMSSISIFQNADGSYEFFNKYLIREDKGRFVVVLSHTEKTFSSLKNAVTWCVHDNQNKFSNANRIEYLDVMISGTEVAIDMHKKLLKKNKDMEFTLIHLAKLNEEKLKRAALLKEMNGFILDSNNLQTKKFAMKR